MNENAYRVVDEFQVRNKRVLVLDRDYEFGNFKYAEVEGDTFSYALCSVRRWIIIDSDKGFIGKEIEFI